MSFVDFGFGLIIGMMILIILYVICKFGVDKDEIQV